MAIIFGFDFSLNNSLSNQMKASKRLKPLITPIRLLRHYTAYFD